MTNKKLKKLISSLLAAVIVICSMSVAFFAYAVDYVAINAINFPDSNFRAVVSDWYDENGDGYLFPNEISSVTFMSVAGMLDETCGEDAVIKDLTGVEKFTSLKRLRCGGIGLTSLNVSSMSQLVELTCEGNELDDIDVSYNSNLEWLNVSSNNLNSIDVSYNSLLTKFECYANKLETIDVSMLTKLSTFRCQQNELTQVNLSKNTDLTVLNCSNNHLTALDLSNNTSLSDVTDYMIGSQTASAKAVRDKEAILVEFSILNPSNVVTTSLDRFEEVGGSEQIVSGYDGVDFIAYSAGDLLNGIDYSYNVGLENSENMSVHIDVERDFYQVNFYTAEDLTTCIASETVNEGEAATAPEITDIPQCKAFYAWSDDFSNITEDKNIYIIWKENHNYYLTGFSNGILKVSCADCDAKDMSLFFADFINSRKGDMIYQPVADVNKDGTINIKDFARLTNIFKNS